MEIWLTQGGIRYRVPVLPSEYELTGESNHTQIDVNALGEISLIGKRKLKQISFSSFFPRRLYPFCEYTSFPTPAESVKLVEEMKDNGILRLIMTGTPINMECTIDRFLWGENDGTGDIFYTLDFREYRRVHIKTKTERETLPDTVQPAATERPAKEVSSTTYTVVSGDSLCKIAKKLTGSSANWKVIYEQNRAVIGGNPDLIYPGQQLVISV